METLAPLFKGIKMEIVVKNFNELNLDELYEILQIRSAVFVVEQTCVYQDIDGIDRNSTHIYVKEDNVIVGYLRLFLREDDRVQIGRVLTTKRNEGYGAIVMEKAMEVIKECYPDKEVYLEAQTYAIDFYRKFGLEVCSEEFLEDGIPHVQMKKASYNAL